MGVILVLVFVLPFASKRVEHNLEIFLFVMGLAAAVISGVLDRSLAAKAAWEPVPITVAVLVSGLLFKALRTRLRAGVQALLRRVSLPVFLFALVVFLGLASSAITAIIAALVLAEIVSVLRLHRTAEVNLVVVACFSIGLGAALTPIGEPLATIAVNKLGETFWFLMRLIGPYVIPGILGLGVFAALYIRGEPFSGAQGDGRKAGEAGAARPETAASAEEVGLEVPEEREDSYVTILVRALKVYLFVMALVFLGEGFRPVIDRYVLGLPSRGLYWLNTVSAILDNATLTAAEISIKMTRLQVRSILMGLVIAGGMLIPGNIPNIISAGKLGIASKEWARLGVPLGLAIMLLYFVVLLI